MLGEFPKKGKIIDLANLPDNMVIMPGAIKVTEVDVPVRLPDGTVCGKARVVEGNTNEVSVLVEIESDNPLVATLFKSRLCGISLVPEEQAIPDSFIRAIKP